MNFEAAALGYVRHVLLECRLSAGALAKASGISTTTLTRALNDPKHRFTLSMKTIEKIATFSKINPAPFLEAANSADLTTGFHHRSDAYLGEKASRNDHVTKNTLVIGEVEAGKWREPSVIPFYDYGPMSLTSTHHDAKDCFACVVRGESANMIANDGEILFCVRAKEEESLYPYWADQVHSVIVERKSKDAFKIELSARFMVPSAEGWKLTSACRQDHLGRGKRKYFDPIFLKNFMGNNEFSIVGTIQWVVRDLAAAKNALLDFRE
jgi:hypothetical protein